jgi:hypothetical protein
MGITGLGKAEMYPDVVCTVIIHVVIMVKDMSYLSRGSLITVFPLGCSGNSDRLVCLEHIPEFRHADSWAKAKATTVLVK